MNFRICNVQIFYHLRPVPNSVRRIVQETVSSWRNPLIRWHVWFIWTYNKSVWISPCKKNKIGGKFKLSYKTYEIVGSLERAQTNFSQTRMLEHGQKVWTYVYYIILAYILLNLTDARANSRLLNQGYWPYKPRFTYCLFIGSRVPLVIQINNLGGALTKKGGLVPKQF